MITKSVDGEFYCIPGPPVKNVQVTETSLSVDLLKLVGYTGNYLTDSSTLGHFPELIQPRLMNPETYENWSAKG